MLKEESKVSCELSERGELVVKNVSSHRLTLWSIEVWFLSHLTPPFAERTILKRQVRDVLVVKKELEPGESARIDLGVSKRGILQIKIHYSQFGVFDVYSCEH